MKDWQSTAAMYAWFRKYARGEVCCIYRGHRVRIASHIDGFTFQL